MSVPTEKPLLSIVIPSYQGGQRLARLLPGLITALRTLPAGGAEIIVVDDGSPSQLRHIAVETVRFHDALSSAVAPSIHCSIVCLPENRGQQLATIVGVAAAKGEIIATMDDDGAHPPFELVEMVRRITAGDSIDLIYGAPRRRAAGSAGRPALDDAHRTARRLGTWCNNALFSVCLGKPWAVPVTSFRVFRRGLAECALTRPVSFPYLSAMLLSCDPAVAAHRYDGPIPGSADDGVTISPAAHDASRYTIITLGNIFWNLLLYWGPLKRIGRVLRPPEPIEIPRGCL